MEDKKKEYISGSPIRRRDFFRKVGTALAGGGLLAVGSGAATRVRSGKKADLYWQIDHEKCIQCGRCETSCVMPVSAVRCMHANQVCGYCDLCGGYYRTNAKELNTAAENMLCPTGAIERKFVEEPYFEYTVDADKCNGCGKCVKGCSSFGNGSLYLQIRQEFCLNCNECNIARQCPSGAISRVSREEAYKFKDQA
ncbi:MAG: 4Fe-4S binding protein [Bacteroidales bacterium]|nr:4Fe-4S binding protein [Bacteroidales bacterium]